MIDKRIVRQNGREGTTPEMAAKSIIVLLLLAGALPALRAQTAFPDGPLDPARDASTLQRLAHVPLPEQYIWTAKDAAALRPDHERFSYREREQKAEPHVFRGSFELKSLPSAATLYIAGPRSVRAFLNGTLVLEDAVNPKSPLSTHVFRAEARSALRIGRNVLAIEAARGRGIVAASDSSLIQQLAYGETLVAKIVPAVPDVDAQSLAVTNPEWRSVVVEPKGWQQSEFDDRTWPRVQALGAIESTPEFFQWNTDAGLYDWPGYFGLSPYLRTFSLAPQAVTHRVAGLGAFVHVEALTSPSTREKFAVRMPSGQAAATDAPGLLVDFGREVSGRLFVESACDCEAHILVSYGESESEALHGGHYLGTNLLRVPPHGRARGPKSGLRYAWLSFVSGAPETVFQTIRLEGIAYPVDYKGEFASSDPLLNRIWETAAYTAHLCMQDGVWDAPKRDRGWWVGDLDASGPVIGDVFGDRFLLDETLKHLVPPDGHHVNGIPGYTALWITTLANLYRHSGDRAALKLKHPELLKLLARMEAEFDISGRFINKDHRWLFVDWSPGLFGFTDAASEGTELEYVLAYHEGAWLLDEVGDAAAAQQYRTRAETVSTQARLQFANANGAYGDRWQLNTMAVLSGVAREDSYPAIWRDVLSDAGQDGPQAQTISPYFNSYLLRAMARMGHRREALNWLRQYWGGMLDEGATSFWESYDLRWSKQDPHLSLQADGTTGYFVSLAHGWSSAPAAWLMEEMLGIHAEAGGFHKIAVRPDLMGLKWAKGQVPTPEGLIRVEMKEGPPTRIDLSLPRGIEATVLVPLAYPGAAVLVNGVAVTSTPTEDGSRAATMLRSAGTYTIISR